MKTLKEIQKEYEEHFYKGNPKNMDAKSVVEFFSRYFTPSIEKEGVTESDINRIAVEMLREGFGKSVGEDVNTDTKFKLLIDKKLIPEYPNLYDQIIEGIIAGIRKGLSLQDRREKWVGVEESPNTKYRILPVLLFNGDAPEYNQHVFKGTWYAQTNSFRSDMKDGFLGTITHWQPLPTPPLVEEKK